MRTILDSNIEVSRFARLSIKGMGLNGNERHEITLAKSDPGRITFCRRGFRSGVSITPSLLARLAALLSILLSWSHPTWGQDTTPAPPTNLRAEDHPFDIGNKIDLRWQLSEDDTADADPKRVQYYRVLASNEPDGPFDREMIATAIPEAPAYQDGEMEVQVDLEVYDVGEPFYFHVVAVGPGETESEPAEAGPVTSSAQLFIGDRFWLAIFTVVLCGAIIFWIRHARRGGQIKVRTIPGLEAVDEAVGRATEMGRSCLFVPGIQDMNNMETIAGITILEHVAKTAATYDAKIEVPTARSLVMTAARETVHAAFMAAGRPEAYTEDLIYYVTDEQFGYVAYLSGMMVREKPAACFYLGAFYAESLILAETGNSIGAIQVAGTAQPAQLPFFVAACDYTLIGEEFFAASAYLSGDAEHLGSLKGQDLGKIMGGGLIIVGCALSTLVVLTGSQQVEDLLRLLTDTVLR